MCGGLQKWQFRKNSEIDRDFGGGEILKSILRKMEREIVSNNLSPSDAYSWEVSSPEIYSLSDQFWLRGASGGVKHDLHPRCFKAA